MECGAVWISHIPGEAQMAVHGCSSLLNLSDRTERKETTPTRRGELHQLLTRAYDLGLNTVACIADI